MKDTIIKCTGNSRTLASVPNLLTLYPTYEAFAQALINRELPIDIGPLNPAGLDVRGDDLNKNNLLKDSTASLYGLGPDAVPDDVLSFGLARVYHGSYVGTGQYNWNYKNSLVFQFNPKFVIILGNNSSAMSIFVETSPLAVCSSVSKGVKTILTDWGDKTVEWYSQDSVISQLNESGIPYHYLAVG